METVLEREKLTVGLPAAAAATALAGAGLAPISGRPEGVPRSYFAAQESQCAAAALTVSDGMPLRETPHAAAPNPT